jgi:hypothetical protein
LLVLVRRRWWWSVIGWRVSIYDGPPFDAADIPRLAVHWPALS